MKKLFLRNLFLALALIMCHAAFNTLFASHIPGANITYTCNPANPLEYTFTLTVFRKCPGTHPTTMSATNFTLTNDCGHVNPVVPIFNQVGVAQDVNQLCNTATSNCSGGTDPGVWMYTYEATITLPANCDGWHLEYDLCCRDASTNMTGTSSNNMVTYTTLNTTTSPCNNSPMVTAQPIPYACTNTNFNYCLTAFDPEGDSITYTMVAPLGAGQTPIAHLAGFSPTQPLSNFTLDPLTGCMSMNEPNVGNYVVAVMIREWDNAGNLVSEIIHDFQIMVISCTNTPPTNPVGGISNFSGTGSQTGPNTANVCYGNTICFDVVFQDNVDLSNNLTITTDGTTLLPGATFVQTGTNPATGTFCWTAQPGFLNDVITFTAYDDGCPVMGTTGFAVDLDITPGVFAGPDVTICGTQSAQLQATNSTAFVWSPATGLSCTNCPNPVASPGVTTTYTVTGNLAGACSNVDQVTVFVVPDFPLNMTPASATICANEVVQLNANAGGGFAPYVYGWDNGNTLTDDSIPNPLAQPLVSTTYNVTVTSSVGCVKTANIPVTVSGVGPTVSVTPATTTLCPGESVQLVTTASVYPVTCGLSSGCTGTTSTVDIGTGTTGSSTYAPMYGSTTVGTDYTSKMQYIYTAAELNAMGYYGGTIQDLAFFFTSSYTYQYDRVTIWMGCTGQDEFTNTTFTSTAGMTQVYGPVDNVNPTNNGWHVFNINDYDWDGVSNIIIQVCAQEDQAGNAGIESVRYTTTSPAYRCMRYVSTTLPSCSNATGSRYTSRANIRFTMCQQQVSAPTYAWSPSASLDNASIANPTASPTANTTYIVNVLDGGSGCTGSGVATVDVEDLTVDITPAGPLGYCTGDPAINLNAQLMRNGVAQAAGGAGANCYDQTITYTNPTLSNGTNNFNFAATPTGSTGGTLTITAYGDLDGAVGGTNEEMWTIRDEGGATLGTAGGSNTQCGYSHVVVVPLTALQINTWAANGSIDFTGVDVAGNISATLCGAGTDMLQLRLQYDCTSGSGYTWSPGAGLSDPNIQNPTASPAATTTYTVSATYALCTVTNTIDINVGTASTAPTMSPMPGTYCPNTTLTITAGGGTAGVGSTMEWYTGPNGSGTWLGSGAALTITPTTSGQNYYVRREGGCNTTADDMVTINLKDYIYGLNGTSTNNYCTDNAGWHHFYNGNEILLSLRGDLTGMPAGSPTITIMDNGAFYQQTQGPGAAPGCAVGGLTPGEEYFEMERNWNVDIGTGTLAGTYDVRFYYDPAERTAIENAAANWMATYPACGYAYKYGNPLGFYWFKNVGSNYTAPDYDGLHLTGAGGMTSNSTNYAEMTGITSFSGGTGGITLVPTILLPVQWLYFDGETDNKTNSLRWATESEQHADFFSIQRSQDGVNFQTIGTSPATGTTTTTSHYTFDDVNPFEGPNYYRLELTDKDGKVTYSNTIMLVIAVDGLGYNFYPNPTNDIVYYQYESKTKESLKIEVLDVLGKQVFAKDVLSTIGANNIPVDLSTFPAGTYMVRVHNEQSAAVHTAKVIKNKF